MVVGCSADKPSPDSPRVCRSITPSTRSSMAWRLGLSPCTPTRLVCAQVGRGAKFCAERDVATADLGVLCAKDEEACYAPGDAFFGKVAHRQPPKLPEASDGASCSSRGPSAAPLVEQRRRSRPCWRRCCTAASGSRRARGAGAAGGGEAPSLIVLDSLIGPQVVSYLAPRAIRLEVDARIRRHGEASSRRACVAEPDLFAGALWWSARLRLPPPLPRPRRPRAAPGAPVVVRRSCEGRPAGGGARRSGRCRGRGWRVRLPTFWCGRVGYCVYAVGA